MFDHTLLKRVLTSLVTLAYRFKSCSDFQIAFASRLAPAGNPGWTHNMYPLEIQCGSEPAREGASPPSADSYPNEDQLTSVASRLIFAFSTLDTGHPSLAFLLNSSNCAWVAPGIFALRISFTAVIAKPPST